MSHGRAIQVVDHCSIGYIQCASTVILVLLTVMAVALRRDRRRGLNQLNTTAEGRNNARELVWQEQMGWMLNGGDLAGTDE